MYKRFPSIAHSDKYAYAYESSVDFRHDPQISHHFRMFETYGDGMIQHSPDWPVTTEFAADFLLSLASACLADEELADAVRYEINQTASRRDIEFAASIVYKPTDETKPRYFSKQDRKISSSREKCYDKRYERIESWCDGSAEAINRIVLPGHCHGIERLAIATGLKDWIDENPHDRPWMTNPSKFIGWAKEHDTGWRIESAYQAARNACEHWRTRDAVNSAIENERHRMQRAAEQAAALAKVAAALEVA